MSKNTLRVTPLTGSNFSRLNKYNKGGDIPRFKDPADALWRKNTVEDTETNARNTQKWEGYHGDLNNMYTQMIAAGHNKRWTADQLNKLEDVSAQDNLSWEQQVNKTGYENWNSAFNDLAGLNQDFFGKDTSKFKYIGPTTWNRHAFVDTLKQKHNSKDNPLEITGGQKVYFDTTSNKWIPVGATELPEETNVPEDDASLQTDESKDSLKSNPKGTTPNLENLSFDLNRNILGKNKGKFFDFPTYPLYNAAKLGNALMGTTRAHNIAMRQKAYLEQGPRLHDVITDDYTYQTGANNAFAQRMSQAAQMAQNTSSADAAYAYQKEAADAVMKAQMDAAQHKDQTYKEQIKENVDVANKNNFYATETANKNLQNITALHNTLLNEQQKYALNKAELWDQYMTSMRTDYLNKNKADQINAHQQWLNENSPLHDAALTSLRNKMIDAQDPEKFYATQYEQFQKSMQLPQGQRPHSYDDFLSSFSDPSYQPTQQDFINYYTLGVGKDSEIGKQMARNFKESANNAYKQYYANANAEITNWNRAQGRWPVQVSGELPYWLSSKYSTYTDAYKPIQFNKQGGVVYRGRDRFLQYMDHNRKITDKSIDNAMKHMIKNTEHLDRELYRLNQQTLILLKAMFS